MKINWKKIIAWCFGSLLGISILLSGGLFIFKDKIISVVVEAINEHLNAKVKVQKIDLTFWKTFPNLSIDFDHLFIQDAYENASDIDTLFYTEKLRLRMNPLKALRKEYTVDRVDIYPGTLQLKVDENGFENYNIIKPSSDTTKSKFDVDLKKINIKNLRFKYDNKSINQCYATDLLDTKLKGNFSTSVFTVHAISTQIVREVRVGKMNIVHDKKAKMDIAVKVNQENGSLEIPKSLIHVSNLPFYLEGFVRPDSLQFKINAQDLSLVDVAQNVNLKEVEKVKEYKGKGKVSFHFLIEDNRENKEAPVIECDFGVVNGALFEPSQKLQINDIQIQGRFSNRGGTKKEHLTLERFQMQSPSGPFSGNLKITEFDAPRYIGKIHGVIALQMLQSIYPIAHVEQLKGDMDIDSQFDIKTKIDSKGKWTFTPNLLMIQSVIKNGSIKLYQDERVYEDINGAFDLNSTRANVRDLSVRVKHSDLKVNGTASNFIEFINNQGDLDIAMNLSSNKLNFLDFYTEAAVQSQTTTSPTKNNSPRQYIFPHNMKGNILINIGTVDFQGHLFDHISGNMRLNNRVLDFNNIQFKTSGAHINGSLKIEERSPEFFFSNIQFSGINIDLSRLLKDWNNFDQQIVRAEHISGNAAVNLKLNAPFDMRNGINYKNIQSTVSLKVNDGRLKGVEAFNEITNNLKTPAAQLVIGKKNVQDIGNRLQDIRFKTLENTIEISNGIVNFPNMSLESSLLNVKLSGQHDFDNNIDYRFGFRFRDLKRDQTSEFGNIIDDGTGLLVFLRMYGNLSNPKFEWDKEAKKQNQKEYNQQEKESIKSMLKSDLGLFKKDTTVKRVQQQMVPRETISIDNGEDSHPEKKKKEGKVSKFLEKMKNEGKEEKNVTFD